MRALAVVVAASLLCPSWALAEERFENPPAKQIRSARSHPLRDDLERAPVRDATRLSFPFGGQSDQSPDDATPERPWVERHPVWSGAIAGAAFGATLGALTWKEPEPQEFLGYQLQLFPTTRGDAAFFGMFWGAPIGALVGLMIGAAN